MRNKQTNRNIKTCFSKQIYHSGYFEILKKSASNVVQKNMSFIACETLSLTESKVCNSLVSFSREADLKNSWERYMTVITSCLLRMYHA